MPLNECMPSKVTSSPDTWPEEYHQEPYRSYARILDEQPDPPRRVSYGEMLKAHFRSRMVLGVIVFGAVSSIIYSIIILSERNAVLKLLVIVVLIGSGVVLVFYPFVNSQIMARALRYGVRTEAHLVRTRERGRDFKARVRFSLGGEVVEREAVANLHRKWLEAVSPKDVLEVLIHPRSGAPRLFLRVKHRDAPAAADGSSRSRVAGARQSGAPEETSPRRRGCLGGSCISYAFLLGLMIAMSFVALAIMSFIFALFSPRGTEEGRRAVESLGLWFLLAGLGVALLLVVPYIILAIVARRKR
jgi:hypothetical protein